MKTSVMQTTPDNRTTTEAINPAVAPARSEPSAAASTSQGKPAKSEPRRRISLSGGRELRTRPCPGALGLWRSRPDC